MKILRKPSKVVKIGKIKIGGNNPIAVQSMLSVPSFDFDGNLRQALALENAGCEILRVAIPDFDSVGLIPFLKNNLKIPLVADIHFDYKLALESIAAGVDKIRINPGNIGSNDNLKKVVSACKLKNIPIRVGLNSGSIDKEILAKYGAPTAEAMCESAIKSVRLLEKFDFSDIIVSVKSSNVVDTIRAYEMLSEQMDYPLHLGVTEVGTLNIGSIKSAIGIGSLLAHDIGDTIRVTLSEQPIREVEIARLILKALELNRTGITVISCPTCGRTRIDVIGMAHKLENLLGNCDKKCKVAVMGCAVNGPGEAKMCDIGIAGGDGFGIIFKKGKVLRKVSEDRLMDEFMMEFEKL